MTRDFPTKVRYSLNAQMNRCAVSISSNIAEGSSKSTDKYFVRFLAISLGAAFEWETQLIIAFNQNYNKEDTFITFETRIQQLQKMIARFQVGMNY